MVRHEARAKAINVIITRGLIHVLSARGAGDAQEVYDAADTVWFLEGQNEMNYTPGQASKQAC